MDGYGYGHPRQDGTGLTATQTFFFFFFLLRTVFSGKAFVGRGCPVTSCRATTLLIFTLYPIPNLSIHHVSSI
jgi:hypothetical protein